MRYFEMEGDGAISILNFAEISSFLSRKIGQFLSAKVRHFYPNLH